jgi:ubiquinone/menaquinone biosynthesis C-methylase UbiE
MRKPWQGVANIVRFNWHFYVLAGGLIGGLFAAAHYLPAPWAGYLYLAAWLAVAPTLISLLVSLYVYDLSGLYTLSWAGEVPPGAVVVNVNAGFDETSALLQAKYPSAQILALDFYDPARHTEVSIKRARKAYPPFPGTQAVATSRLPLADGMADRVFVLFAAHEVRDEGERTDFLRELRRICQPDGQVWVTEHLRDWPNFLAYNFGFFHFHAKASWLRSFLAAGLAVEREIKLTPFISTFILTKHGNTP